MRIRILIVLLAAIPILANAEGGPDISGNWTRSDGTVRMRVASCGNQICAINTWIKDANSGEAVGDKLIMTLAPQGTTRLAGSAYDVRRDASYSLQISVQDEQMQTRGCMLVGVVCKSLSWIRAQ
jgi:uncharacterized protein (DUF2147 family)